MVECRLVIGAGFTEWVKICASVLERSEEEIMVELFNDPVGSASQITSDVWEKAQGNIQQIAVSCRQQSIKYSFLAALLMALWVVA